MFKKIFPIFLFAAFSASTVFAAGEENKHMSMDHKPSAAEKAKKPAAGKAAESVSEENKHMSMDHKPAK